MSICAHGRSRLNCVCRWTSGLRRFVNPPIHILAGEKVCIQAMTPMHASDASAAASIRAISSGVVTTRWATIRTGMSADSSRHSAIRRACSSTVRSDVRSVEVLAAGDEPGLQLAQRVAHPFTAPDMKPRM